MVNSKQKSSTISCYICSTIPILNPLPAIARNECKKKEKNDGEKTGEAGKVELDRFSTCRGAHGTRNKRLSVATHVP